MRKVYFDHSATTPLDTGVKETMEPYWTEVFGNVSSVHSFGQEALKVVDKARERVASFLNCKPAEVVFTSGATESDNLAVKGLVKALLDKGVEKPHVITTTVEHDAILEPLMELEKQGVEVDHVAVDKSGVVKVDCLKDLIRESTVLISVMWVNSESGAIMPIKEIGKVVRKVNEQREKVWRETRVKNRGERPTPIYFHSDATQALNFIQANVEEYKIDMLSFSGHKIYGPKGVGALYVRTGVPLRCEQRGGHHEGNRRSGTINVTGIVGLGGAVAQLSQNTQEKENEQVRSVRDYLVEQINNVIPDVRLNTNRAVSTPAHAHYSFLGCEGESILISLDLEGIAVSTGSACAASSLKASHVVLAMGIPVEESHSSIRFSLGKHNTKEEVDYLMTVLPAIIKRLRKMNPLYKK